MVNILLATHGPLAEGFKESLRMFFGDSADMLSVLGLYPNESPETYKDKIQKIIKIKDDGDGVLVFTDIPNATPYNMVAVSISEMENHKIQCIAGVNMPLIMEAMASAYSGTIEEIVKRLQTIAPSTIVNLRENLDI